MSAHLPIRIARPAYGQCIFQRPNARPFSTTMAQQKRRVNPLTIDPAMIKAHAQQQRRSGPSPSVQSEQQMSDMRNLPDDVGLIPGTFIRAPVRELWRTVRKENGVWDTVKILCSYHFRYLKEKGTAWYLLYRFRKMSPVRRPLHFWERKSMKAMALDKYIYMYQSFARGNIDAITRLCASTIAKKFTDGIAQRNKDSVLHWEATVPKVSLVSNRAQELGMNGYENTGIQQMVFRITCAAQTLHKRKGARKAKGNVKEYLVLQRWMVRGVYKDWAVWGFVDEWSPKSIEEEDNYQMQTRAYQAEPAVAR